MDRPWPTVAQLRGDERSDYISFALLQKFSNFCNAFNVGSLFDVAHNFDNNVFKFVVRDYKFFFSDEELLNFVMEDPTRYSSLCRVLLTVRKSNNCFGLLEQKGFTSGGYVDAWREQLQSLKDAQQVGYNFFDNNRYMIPPRNTVTVDRRVSEYIVNFWQTRVSGVGSIRKHIPMNLRENRFLRFDLASLLAIMPGFQAPLNLKNGIFQGLLVDVSNDIIMCYFKRRSRETNKKNNKEKSKTLAVKAARGRLNKILRVPSDDLRRDRISFMLSKVLKDSCASDFGSFVFLDCDTAQNLQKVNVQDTTYGGDPGLANLSISNLTKHLGTNLQPPRKWRGNACFF